YKIHILDSLTCGSFGQIVNRSNCDNSIGTIIIGHMDVAVIAASNILKRWQIFSQTDKRPSVIKVLIDTLQLLLSDFSSRSCIGRNQNPSIQREQMWGKLDFDLFLF